MSKFIDFLERLQEKSALRYKKKRERKIRKLMMELYRESALFKVEVKNLNYMKTSDSKNNIKYRWFVDCTDKYIN